MDSQLARAIRSWAEVPDLMLDDVDMSLLMLTEVVAVVMVAGIELRDVLDELVVASSWRGSGPSAV